MHIGEYYHIVMNHLSGEWWIIRVKEIPNPSIIGVVLDSSQEGCINFTRSFSSPSLRASTWTQLTYEQVFQHVLEN